MKSEILYYSHNDLGGGLDLPKQEAQETLWTPEQPITAEVIWRINHSDRAENNRQDFNANKRAGKMRLVKGCIDARRLRAMATKTMFYDTIAGGGDLQTVTRMINNNGIELVDVESHHGPEIIGESPTECGGRDAKAKQVLSGNIDATRGNNLDAYITKDVKHHDAVIQAYLTASAVAKLTEKPVAVTAQNHRTGEKKLIAVMHKKGRDLSIQTAIPDLSLIYGDGYIPEELYAEGIPSLNLKDVQSDTVRAYLEEYDDYLRSLQPTQAKREEYRRTHTVHDPLLMTLTTDIRSSGITKPHIFDVPGSIVRLSAPRSRKLDANQHVRFTSEDKEKAWAQGRYVISHAAENSGKPKMPFSSTKTVFIATPNMEQAIDLASELATQDFMLRWLLQEDKKVIVGQMQAGYINDIAEMAYDISYGRITNIQFRG